MTPAELRAWVADSRARQGLGPTITDPAAQQQVAAMAADALTRQSDDGAVHADDGPTTAKTSTARSRARRKAGGRSTAAGATRRRHRKTRTTGQVAGADGQC